MSFYSQAIHGDSANVWKQFDRDTSYPHSTNYTDEKDAKEQHIQTINDNGKNIEDKYYGEKTSTYDNDHKYYANGGSSTDDTWLYILGGVALLALLVK